MEENLEGKWRPEILFKETNSMHPNLRFNYSVPEIDTPPFKKVQYKWIKLSIYTNRGTY